MSNLRAKQDQAAKNGTGTGPMCEKVCHPELDASSANFPVASKRPKSVQTTHRQAIHHENERTRMRVLVTSDSFLVHPLYAS